ncbi:MAG TPA: aminodeoxychorismate lyase [Gammaproteobacteria bacterium]|nr:aminodeoxychorismate lyase [Gammaproteobacteria bacterium]
MPGNSAARTATLMFLINGEHRDSLPATDRGLQYGDGLFETVAVIAGRPQHWQAHLKRLEAGCARLGIPFPGSTMLDDEFSRMPQSTGRWVLKIIVTRGSGGRGYRPPMPAQPTRVLCRYPWPDYPDDLADQGVRTRVCTTRLGFNPALAGVKHLNRLEQVMARREWDDAGIAEGLMCDAEGRLISGTMSNLFLVTRGRVGTPILTHAGVAGVMREQVIDACRQLNLPVDIGACGEPDLKRADEVFLTNSLIGIWPVIEIVGTGGGTMQPGPVTRALRTHMQELGALPQHG